MGWVDSDIDCPKCNYKFCYQSCNYRSMKGCIHCSRCGYVNNRVSKYDVEKGKRVHEEVKNLIKESKLNEAIKILELTEMPGGSDAMLQWVDKAKNELLEEVLKNIEESDFKFFFLKDDEGYVLYDDEIKSDCLGTYWYKMKGEIGTNSIRDSTGLPGFKTWCNDLKEKLEDAGYTEKREAKWFAVSLKFAKELEFQDDDYWVGGIRMLIPYKEYTGEETPKSDG